MTFAPSLQMTGDNTQGVLAITGDASAEFSLNGGEFTKLPTAVAGNTNTVQVRLTTSTTPGDQVAANLSVGDSSVTCVATTKTAPMIEAKPTITNLSRIGEEPLVVGTQIRVKAMCADCDASKTRYEWTADNEVIGGGDSLTITDAIKAKLVSVKASVYSFSGSPGGSALMTFQRDRFIKLVSNGYATVGLTSGGKIQAWGEAEYGGLAPKNIPPKIKKIFPLTAYYHTGFAAVADDGKVISWGRSLFDSKKTEFNSDIFPEIAGLLDLKVNDEGLWAVLRTDGTVVSGELGESGVKIDSVQQAGIVEVHSLAKGFVALNADGGLVVWGENECVSRIPKEITQVKRIIVHPDGRDCSGAIIKADGTAEAWGEPIYTSTLNPAQLTEVVDIIAGGDGYAAIKKNGSVYGWGGAQMAPTESLTDVVEVLGNHNGFVARKTDGSVVFWANKYDAEIQGNWTDIISIKKVAQGFLGLRKDGTLAVYGYKREFEGFDTIKDVESIPDQPTALDWFVVKKHNNQFVQFGANVDVSNSEQLENFELLQHVNNEWSAIKMDGSLYRWGEHYGYKPYQNGIVKAFDAHGGVRKQTDKFIIYNDNTLVDPTGKVIKDVADFATIGDYTEGQTVGYATLDTAGVLSLKYKFYDYNSVLISEANEVVSNVKSIVQGENLLKYVYFVKNDNSVWRYDGVRLVKIFDYAEQLKLISTSIYSYGVLLAVQSGGRIAYDDPTNIMSDVLIKEISKLSGVVKMHDHFLFEKSDRSLEYCGGNYSPPIEFGKIKQVVTTKYSAGVITDQDDLVVLTFSPSSFYTSLKDLGRISINSGNKLQAKRVVNFNDMLLIQLMNDRWEYYSFYQLVGSIADNLSARSAGIVSIIPGSYRTNDYYFYQVNYLDGSSKIFDFYGELTAYSEYLKDADKVERDPIQELWLIYTRGGSVVPVNGSGLNLTQENLNPNDLVSGPIYLN